MLTHEKNLEKQGPMSWMPLTSEVAGWEKVRSDPKHAVEIARDSPTAAHLALPDWLADKSSLSSIKPDYAPACFSCPWGGAKRVGAWPG